MFISSFEMPSLDTSALAGIVDLEIVKIGGNYYLYGASGQTNSISIVDIGGDGSVVSIDTEYGVLPNDTLVSPDLNYSYIGGQQFVVHSSSFQQATEVRLLQTGGDLAPAVTSAFDGNTLSQSGSGSQNQMQHALTLNVLGQDYMVASQYGAPGLQLLEIDSSYNLTSVDSVPDTDINHLGDVSALTTAEIGGKTYVIAASASDTGITSFRLDPDGSLHERSNVAPGGQLGIYAPSEMEVVKLNGQIFVVIGSPGSNSVSVLELGLGGYLSTRDHMIDEANTYFDNLTAMEVIQLNGRAIVLAGGADDGISILEVDASGQLHHLQSLTDTPLTSLQNVSAIRGVVLDDQIQVYVTSATEVGVTQFSIDISTLGIQMVGGFGSDNLVGTDGDDIILGLDGSDLLSGGLGDDRLVGGHGSDGFVGGAGADTFVFAADQQRDIIHDYEDGIDKIDLSAWGFLYSIDQLSIHPRTIGVSIFFGGEEIIVSDIARTLTTADMDASDFVL